MLPQLVVIQPARALEAPVDPGGGIVWSFDGLLRWHGAILPDDRYTDKR
ncbi:MAG: hypothetical protein HYY23_13295 [Verrucomicrobia bacterium]|nr:hypothetical protein [Verrucomicrobiota bacterium]